MTALGEIALVALAGMVFGVAGTGVGALLGVAVGMPSPRALACLLNLTGGLMIALACFKMLPNAYALSAPMGMAGMLMGVVATLALDALLRRRMRVVQRTQASEEEGLARAGLMVAAGSALHNLPEGLAVGSGCAQAPALGLALAAMILLHDVPEGMAAALPMRASGVGAARALAMTAASGVPAGVGAAAGLVLGGVSPDMLALCMGLAGGTVLQVAAEELIPRAEALESFWGSSLCLTLGVALGSAVSLIV